MDDRRSFERRVSEEFGRICGGVIDVPCRAIDRSVDGMRLSVHSSDGLPDSFTVEMLATGEQIPCEVAWRKPTEIGVAIRPGEPTGI